MVETGKRRRPPLKARPRADSDYRQISGQLSEALSVGFQYLADCEVADRARLEEEKPSSRDGP